MAKKRTAKVKRGTKETSIDLRLDLDGKPGFEGRTPIPFLNHMLDLLAAHGGFALSVKAAGDVDVDDHHLVEDLGICLGQALKEALGDKRGIQRYGQAVIPMDEVVVLAAVDLEAGVRRGAADADEPLGQPDLIASRVRDAIPARGGITADGIVCATGLSEGDVSAALARLVDDGLLAFGHAGWCLTDRGRRGR